MNKKYLVIKHIAFELPNNIGKTAKREDLLELALEYIKDNQPKEMVEEFYKLSATENGESTKEALEAYNEGSKEQKFNWSFYCIEDDLGIRD